MSLQKSEYVIYKETWKNQRAQNHTNIETDTNRKQLLLWANKSEGSSSHVTEQIKLVWKDCTWEYISSGIKHRVRCHDGGARGRNRVYGLLGRHLWSISVISEKIPQPSEESILLRTCHICSIAPFKLGKARVLYHRTFSTIVIQTMILGFLVLSTHCFPYLLLSLTDTIL